MIHHATRLWFHRPQARSASNGGATADPFDESSPSGGR